MSISTTGPKAKQVKDYVLNQLDAGLIGRGDAVPTEGELAKVLGVGRHSVRRAMDDLTRAGIVQRIQGKGTFVSIHKPQETTGANKLKAFALVLPEVRSGIYPSLIKGFGQGAATAHHQSLLLETEGDLRNQGDVILRLLHSNVAGVAIVPAFDPMPDYQVEVLRDHNIPILFCHRRTTELDAPLIAWPWEEVGRLAAASLADLGHTRIAFADTLSVPADGYIQGMRAELNRRGIDVPDSRIFLHTSLMTNADIPDWDELLSAVLDAPGRATGIFCGDDYVSERLYMAAMQRGLRVPEDISIIGFGPSWRDGALREKLAAVTIDEMEVGRSAATLLGQMRTGRLALDSRETITVDVKLYKGASLGPPSSH